ncbi:MAG: hypothetical protein RBR35_14065 [Salinivirgaceae bacterium]|nr:hypothetical protein [Salinivirgaceae bacterium]
MKKETIGLVLKSAAVSALRKCLRRMRQSQQEQPEMTERELERRWFRPFAFRPALFLFIFVALCYTNVMAVRMTQTVKVNPKSKAVEPFWVWPNDDLRLIIKPRAPTPKDPTQYNIAWSEILTQSMWDLKLWKKTSEAPSAHIYDIVNAFPGVEFMSVIGELTSRGDGGSGRMPMFQVTVPEVDIDWDKPGYREDPAERGEDTRILWIGPDVIEPFIVRRPIERTDYMFPDNETKRPMPDLEFYPTGSGLLVYTTLADARAGVNPISFPRLIPRETWTSTSASVVRFFAKQDPAQQILPPGEQEIRLKRINRDKRGKPTPFEGDVSGVTYDEILFRLLRVDLEIWNGGSDLDNGEAIGPPGARVPEKDKKSVGAYLLVNWDDDDGTGVMNSDGTWSALPASDLTKNFVANEDNLAKLKPTVEPLLDTGTMELEVSGADAGKIKLWTQSTKGTPITLTSNKKVWNLDSPTEKVEFLTFMHTGYWIEGTDAGTTERGVTFTLRYKDNGGKEIGNDVCKATVVMIKLGAAVYREMSIFPQSRGHAGLLTYFFGPCTAANLVDASKYEVTEMQAGPDDCISTTWKIFHGATAAYWGAYDCSQTYVDRLKVLAVAKYILNDFSGQNINYTLTDVLEPNSWDGLLHHVESLRCDGLVELCYEWNGLSVWGKLVNGNPHYSIITYTREHNAFLNDWKKILFPSTQCGWEHTYRGLNWETQLSPTGVVAPLGDIIW